MAGYQEVTIECPCCGENMVVTYVDEGMPEGDDWENSYPCDCFIYLEGSELEDQYSLITLYRARIAAGNTHLYTGLGG